MDVIFLHDWYFRLSQPWTTLLAVLAAFLAAAITILAMRFVRR